jgi:hypothetical protein
MIAFFEVVVALAVLMAPLPQRPYVSCIDGHVVENLGDCPVVHKPPAAAPPMTGGGGRRGLLGLGGIGGIL